MNPRRLALCLLLLVACTDSTSVPAPGEFDDSSPMLIGFAAPALFDSSERGAVEARAHLEFALSDTIACLGLPDLGVEILLQNEVVVHHRGGTATHRLVDDQAGSSVGVVLVGTSRPPMVVFASAGPSSLSFTLPNAAAEYFERDACRREL